MQWNCSSATSWEAYAFGYKVGDVDNGSLSGGMDSAISASGGLGSSTTGYYAYSDTTYDSFFYRWLPIQVDQTGSGNDNSQTTSSMISPETKQGISTASITLPTKMTEDNKGYVETKYEAVFSKEYREKDNLGDINQDGIPDIYAILTWKSGEALADASSDIKSLASYWVEGDYLPMVYAQWGNGTFNYAPGPVNACKFTAFKKLRGFHEGLNDTKYAYKSEADFSPAEELAYQAAFYKWKFAATENRAWTSADGFANTNYQWTEVNGYNLTSSDDTVFAWSPEPETRMDLMLTDTDADDLPDGWEYFFWYQAKVWAPAAQYLMATNPEAEDLTNKSQINKFGMPCKGQTYVFERFNAKNIIEGTEIPLDEVIAHFNPVAASSDTLDFDGDGLADLEELALGTNPCHWDTDGDHMSDAWEVLMGTNALKDNRGENADGDYMAFYSTKGLWRTTLEDGTVVFAGAGSTFDLGQYMEDSSATEVQLPTNAVFKNVLVVQPKWLEDGTTPYLYGRASDVDIDSEVWARQMVEKPAGGWRQELTISLEWKFTNPEVAITNELILIHSQVYEAFGFDPRTAWGGTTGAYLSERWEEESDEAGVAVNTVPYADYDEYLLRRYRQDMETIPTAQKLSGAYDSEFECFMNWTTCPTIVLITNVVASVDSTATTEQAKAYQEALDSANGGADASKILMSVHGADTNGSGVPDGWTLYVGANPCLGGDVGTAKDDDELEFADEFAGTDSCNAYKDCETIYANHPGIKSGWYNKFFPTDPADPDTDGDGVSDSDEGKKWKAAFQYEGKTYEGRTFSFIYGTPEDDNSRCIRGGGMNPCAVDTDHDGLPDGWERQYAGLPFQASSSKFEFVTNIVDKIETIEVIEPALAQLRADGLLSTQTLAQVVTYIAGGMDATWSGDSQPSAQDDWLGRVRDLDFDHDGLANGQEYLVQQMRHFRYDDDVTPLMGRVLKGASEESRAGAMRGSTEEINNIYVSMAYGRAGIAARCEMLSPGVYSEQAPAFQLTEDVWRTLGYFAPPLREWDKSANYIMLPPSVDCTPGDKSAFDKLTEKRYVSTDPRMADTDEDGMDDYWELYHGLNPILGNVDVIAEAYNRPSSEAASGEIVLIASQPLSAYYNTWTKDIVGSSMSSQIDDTVVSKLLDPVLYPWMMGLPQADPDGDGLRNDEEKVLADLASPLNYHTDPSPAWFTDWTTNKSYTALYYRVTPEMVTLPFWTITTGSNIDDIYYEATLPYSSLEEGKKYIVSFETTEGYDTDYDWKSDGTELARTVRQSTDPLNFADPTRRQALYLDGVNAYAKTYRVGMRKTCAVDFYKQFTVEAWVCPEKISETTEYTIVDRSSRYPSSTLAKTGNIRANFRLGVKGGKPYGLFDNSDAVETGTGEPTSCQCVVSSAMLEAGKWTHLALTYTGTTLSLYVNGELAAYAGTTLIPATGVYSIQQTAGQTAGTAKYAVYPSLFTIGARPVKTADLDNPDMQEFFKGWVDEVRVWDGARSATEVRSAYKTAFTFDEVATNREEVYTHLMSSTADSSRNDNLGKKALTPELVQHYNFTTLPSAANPKWVITEPVGFTMNTLSQINETAKGNGVGKIGLLAQDARNQNAVYDSPYFTTWIPNTVDHLPILDGSAADTFMYAKYLCGYGVLASETGVTMHNLRNSANPYSGHEISVIDRTMRLLKLDLLQEQLPSSEIVTDVVNRYLYTIRSGFTAAGDLLACGNAYAKACPTMWDDLGASSPWEDTVVDSNANGLPDWWEAMYSKSSNLSWNDLVDYNGKQIPAWQAYLRDLAKGMQPDGSIDSDYIQTADSDGDGLVDWWKELYGLKGDANADDDGDGLSNYVEYLLSEVFDLGLTFDPTVACSVNVNVSDYFYRIGQMYVGEIFTDHDRISDVWEDNYATKYASRYIYDAEDDADGDGWSNYAEFLAGTDPEQVSLRNIDGGRLPEYPVPTIEGNFVYDGAQNVEGHTLIVKAFSDSRLESIPDAIWTIGGGNTNLVSDAKYLGYNSGLSQSFRLPPGKINPGSVVVTVKDFGLQVWHASANYVKEYMVNVHPNKATWEELIFDRVHSEDEHTGDLVMRLQTELTSNVVETVVGSINYTTGETTIDFSQINDSVTFDGDVTGTWPDVVYYSTGGVAYRHVTVYNLASSFFRINWMATPLVESGKVTYYLGSADARSETNNSYGHVKEGKNTFIAFYDLDDNGEYTAGEPYGVALGVNVGWNTVPLTINLTDTSPVFARIKAIKSANDTSAVGTNDRTAIWGTEDDCPLVTKYGFTEGTSSGGSQERIRVVRTAIDGNPLTKDALHRVVLDKVVSASAESYITEADILKDALDLDWDNLAKDIASESSLRDTLAVTSVWYRIVMGNGDISKASGMLTNNIMSVFIARRFDGKAGYAAAKPIILTSGDVKTPQPTFKWRLTNDALNSYTAFRVWVYAEDGKTLVWESDYEPMPPRVWDSKLQCHTYTWQPPLYADALLPDGSNVFENGKNYQWKIEVYNAKFNPQYNKTMTRNPSDPATFFMNVLTNSVDYGQINLAVRYYGPDVVAANGKIRIQAFTSADFMGSPVAEGYVYNMDDIASTNALTTNARIIGLEQGIYYIRAFIDTKTPSQEKFDGQFAAWKSWGIVCNRDDKLAKIYVPKPVTISSRVGISPTIPLYIEDCDTDHDMLPDAWEMQTKGNLTSLTTSSLDQVLPGGFAMQESLTKKIDASGTLPSGLSAIMRTSLSSPYVAAFLMDVSSDPDTAVAALASATSELDTEESSVVITNIAIDSEKNDVVLDYATDLQTASETLASRIYSFDTKNLNLILWRTDSLGEDASWYQASDPISIDFDTESGSVSVALPEDQDLTSGFYKVTVEKAN